MAVQRRRRSGRSASPACRRRRWAGRGQVRGSVVRKRVGGGERGGRGGRGRSRCQRGMHRDNLREIKHEMMVCLPADPGLTADHGRTAGPGRTMRLLFFRGPGPDFSERDRALLTLLRPHLHQAYLDAERRRRGTPQLTPRHQVSPFVVPSSADLAAPVEALLLRGLRPAGNVAGEGRPGSNSSIYRLTWARSAGWSVRQFPAPCALREMI
jgi:hypothetical protein